MIRVCCCNSCPGSFLFQAPMKLQFEIIPRCLSDHMEEGCLPPPIRSNVPDSWAHDTMSRRIIQEIFPRILSENTEYLQSHEEVADSLEALRESLQKGPNGYLQDIDDNEKDALHWNTLLKSLETHIVEQRTDSRTEEISCIDKHARNWLDAPWFIAEAYFYRRVCASFHYFETKYDCFAYQKCKGLIKSFPESNTLAVTLLMALKEGNNYLSDSTNAKRLLEIACLASLWGNMMDLSLWPVSTTSNATMNALAETDRLLNETSEQYILNNHLPELLSYLQAVLLPDTSKDKPNKKAIEIWVDNAGYELITDLFLAETLLSIANNDDTADENFLVVVIRCKKYPTFVSDVTIEDIHRTIETLLHQTAGMYPSLYDMAVRLSQRLYNSKQILLEESYFLCQGDACWDMPESHYSYKNSSNYNTNTLLNDINMIDHNDGNLHQEELQEILAPSLVIVKGDANYRRLLGDRHWPFHVSNVNEVLSYWPIPVVAFRTCKAEIAVGLSEVTVVNNSDENINVNTTDNMHNKRHLFRGKFLPKNWLVSGRYALIQFYQPPSSE